MNTSFRGKHLVSLEDWNRNELDTLFEVSKELKRNFAQGIGTPYLQDQTGFLIFFNTSTRTRNSMEAGLTQLGGHAHFLDTSGMQISHGESPKDTATILSSYGHMIACRYCGWQEGDRYIRELAQWSRVPVINMQSDLYHPLQGIADLMTIEERFRDTRGLNVSVIWAYATSHKKAVSVPLTQILLFPRYGMNVTLAYPEGYQLPEWSIQKAKQNAIDNGGSFRITHDMEEAYKGADIVIPKNWGDWVVNPSKENRLSGDETYTRWKCTEAMMSLTNQGSVYMHALPADRGNEVEDAVLDGPQSIVYQEAENRLHTAKAVMSLVMGGRS